MVKIRVVPARVIEHEPEVAGIAVLPGVGVFSGHRPVGEAGLTLAEHPRSETEGAGFVE